ncbi:tellurium resistance protein TerC [Chryseobacterium artocarpi]|uniref:Tellurium resistance protein TerC n=2 Tax=Chryseobacterium artocarpi TaxID=1414727 RepID=A0A1B8ZXP3_9FLAO|nr:tellurium resistance protein TerC [Chryseobacterium artocarpi]
MGTIKKYYIKVISILLAILFLYAAMSKALDFENFQIQLAQSPLLSAYAEIISYSIIIIEIIVAICLFIPYTNRLGLYASLGLMSAFTVYIYLILNYSDFIPCSCGGILEKLGWTEHLLFNLFFVILTITAILINDFHVIGWRRPALYCGIATTASCLAVSVLFLRSEHTIKKENNFTRRFLLNPIAEEKKFNMGSDSYYFAGIDNSRIYLGSSTAPLWLTSLDLQLKDTVSFRLYLDRSDYPFRNLQTLVKNGFYYLFDGSVPIIYRGTIGNRQARTISTGDAYFTQMIVLDTIDFALRSQSRKNKQYILARLKLDSTPKVSIYENILQKQVDGVFDSDGRLLSDDTKNKLIYIYGYRNQIIKMDNNLKVLDSLRTIDTVSRVKISVVQLSDGRHKMNTPPFRVNKSVAMDHGYLYNESNLKGKHESSAAWRNSAIIDIYNIEKKEYVGSFYIRKNTEEKIVGMIANGKFLYVLIGHELRRLRFRDALLN